MSAPAPAPGGGGGSGGAAAGTAPPAPSLRRYSKSSGSALSVAAGGGKQRTFGPGSLFGEGVLLHVVPHRHTLRCVIGPAKLWSLKRTRFRRCLAAASRHRLQQVRLSCGDACCDLCGQPCSRVCVLGGACCCVTRAVHCGVPFPPRPSKPLRTFHCCDTQPRINAHSSLPPPSASRMQREP